VSPELKNAVLATLFGEREGRSIEQIAAPIQMAEALSIAADKHPNAVDGDITAWKLCKGLNTPDLPETPQAIRELHEQLLTPYMDVLQAVCALEADGLLESMENGRKSRITKRGCLHIISLIASSRLAMSGEDLGDVSTHLFEEV